MCLKVHDVYRSTCCVSDPCMFVLLASDDWKLSITTGSEEGFEAPGPLAMVFYGDKGVSQMFKIGEGEEECFKTGDTKDFNPEVRFIYHTHTHTHICIYIYS